MKTLLNPMVLYGSQQVVPGYLSHWSCWPLTMSRIWTQQVSSSHHTLLLAAKFQSHTYCPLSTWPPLPFLPIYANEVLLSEGQSIPLPPIWLYITLAAILWHKTILHSSLKASPFHQPLWDYTFDILWQYNNYAHTLTQLTWPNHLSPTHPLHNHVLIPTPTIIPPHPKFSSGYTTVN